MPVTIQLSESGESRVVDAGTPVRDVLPARSPEGLPYLGAIAGGEIVSLNTPLAVGGRVRGLTAADDDGWAILRRSMCLLLAMAVRRALPDRFLRVRHSLGCGVWATLRDGDEAPERPATARECAAVEKEMRAIAASDEPFVEELGGYEETVAQFAAEGRHDKVGLLRHRNDPIVPLVRCGAFRDLRQGPCVPRAGLLSLFELFRYEGGLLLQMPSRSDPGRVAPFAPQPALMRVHREHARWGDILGVHGVGELNQAVAERRIADVMEMGEALHDKGFSRLADLIAARKPRPRLVLIAGPSSAGKTTSCRRLAIHLRVVGLRPVQLSTDDYFVAEKDDPIGPDGKPDYEDIRAVDVAGLRKDLAALIAGRPVKRRVFDFRAKAPTWTDESLRLGPDDVVLIEGIHALNPILSEGIPREQTFKIYLSALTQLGIDDDTILSTSDNRLVRRLVRDHLFRGHDAKRTLSMWPSVRRGEEKWIFPFQGEADVSFNTSLDYELSVLRPFAEALLAEIKPGDAEYPLARRLQAVLRNFHPIPATAVPGDSILREYIGGSTLRY